MLHIFCVYLFETNIFFHAVILTAKWKLDKSFFFFLIVSAVSDYIFFVCIHHVVVKKKKSNKIIKPKQIEDKNEEYP